MSRQKSGTLAWLGGVGKAQQRRTPKTWDGHGSHRMADWIRASAICTIFAALISFEASASVFIVDQAATGASDNNTGTEEKPFKTIQHAADVTKPGDVVLVMAGNYPERVKLKTSGGEGQPITFGAKPRRTVVMGGFDVQANFIRIEGFEITADKPVVAVQLGGGHCQIVDNYIHDMMVAISGTVGKPGPDGTRDYSAVAHNQIAYNKVYHSQYGFMLGGNDWLVENNEVSRLFMYTPGNQYDDCDYSRFFGKGCVERCNYYHGSTASEIRVAHVDCLQTFTVNGEFAQDLLFENNTCFDFHQLCMVESAPHIGSVSNWTFRGNIVSANSPSLSGGWGPDIIQTLNVTIDHNTISTVRWSAIGLRGKESTGGVIRNNILCDAERAIVDGDKDFTAANPVSEYNLTFKTWAAPGEKNINGKDPMFVDPGKRDFRVQKGSPAIGAGEAGATIGALDYPNIYYVDPRHPAATDEPAWGYPAVPLASLAKACAVAQPGETIILRGGVYRETLRPQHDGVIVRAAIGENVTINTADVVGDWKSQPDGTWTAELKTPPKKLLRDGEPWNNFTYDSATKRLIVKNSDPRLHLFESIAREHGIDLAGKKNVKIENISVSNAPSDTK